MAALELREPDRVPTLDVMEEYANIYKVLEKKPTPLGFLFTNRYTSRLVDGMMPLINRLHLMGSEMDRFSHDRTEAAVKMGYDAAWVMRVPIWRFRNSIAHTDGMVYPVLGWFADCGFDGGHDVVGFAE